MKFIDLLVEHPYYCSQSNYYCNEAGQQFQTWKAFYEEWGTADIDYNTLFRFDVRNDEDGFRIELFYLQQRKGIFFPILISSVEESDHAQIISFLEKHWKYMIKLWKPFSKIKK